MRFYASNGWSFGDFHLHSEKLRIACAVLAEVDLDGVVLYAREVGAMGEIALPAAFTMLGASNLDDVVEVAERAQRLQERWLRAKEG